MATRLHFKREEGNGFANAGWIQWRQQNYEQAIRSYSASLQIRLALKDTVAIGRSYNRLGDVYGSTGNYPESLKNYFTALKYFELAGIKQKYWRPMEGLQVYMMQKAILAMPNIIIRFVSG